jgi:two-component system phosphate regulon sensor histidine kinase PhoR
MGKKMFVFIIFLMTVSLIGIIIVQIFWISNAIEIRKNQFTNEVNFALAKTSDRIYKKDFIDFTAQYMDFFDTKEFAKKVDFSKFVYEQINTTTNETFRFSSSNVIENMYYKGLDNFHKNDSLLVAAVTSKMDVYKVRNYTNDFELDKVSDVEKITFYNSLTEIDKLNIEDTYHNKSEPINNRLSKELVLDILSEELKNRGVDVQFQYGVVSQGKLTGIRSNYFKIEKNKSFKTKLFPKDKGTTGHELYVTFLKKENYILSDFGGMLLLSVFFTIIIMLAFASSLYQLVKQKKISTIKTDFINNMTHEFKTPIATINLALDAIKNPKVIKDAERVNRYVSMIKEENIRMHTQVENVLRISKLDKNQLDLPKEPIDFYELLEEAVSIVDLLLKSKEGTISISSKHKASEGLGNSFHLTNVFVNILENAIKYSLNAPMIDVFTESSEKYLIVKIKDQGIGMNKSAQKQAFEKFYREQKGDVHDVKGHGLGLSYVKEIVSQHEGTVDVESVKGKGSTFIVKLPLVSLKNKRNE